MMEQPWMSFEEAKAREEFKKERTIELLNTPLFPMMHIYTEITLPLLEAMEEKDMYFCWPETYVHGIDFSELLKKEGYLCECKEGWCFGKTHEELNENLKLLWTK